MPIFSYMPVSLFVTIRDLWVDYSSTDYLSFF